MMPWRVMAYKAFNTFIDDVFAWIVDMPMKHRLMTLRDDVVFLFLLYQWWTYRVDKTRANEFGIAYEKPAEVLEAEGKEAAALRLQALARGRETRLRLKQD